MPKKLYTEKTKKRPASKIDEYGLSSVPNYKKKINKKAAHNSKVLSTLDIKWQD